MKAECNVSFSLITVSDLHLFPSVRISFVTIFELYSILSIRTIKSVIFSSVQLISNFGKRFLWTESISVDRMLSWAGKTKPIPSWYQKKMKAPFCSKWYMLNPRGGSTRIGATPSGSGVISKHNCCFFLNQREACCVPQIIKEALYSCVIYPDLRPMKAACFNYFIIWKVLCSHLLFRTWNSGN